MAIPISEYISIATKKAASIIGERDFSGLVFTKVGMKDGAPKADDYEDGKVVEIVKGEVRDNFDNADFVAALEKYFAYNGGTRSINHIYVVLVGDEETASAALARVTGGSDGFYNFGSFYFYGTISGINEAMIGNEGNAFGWVGMVKTDASGQASASAALDGLMLTHLTHAPIEAMAYYAAVDYNQPNSAGSIDYKQFPGSVATVDSLNAKTTADNLKVNYIGLVQNYGNGMKFYQKGVNMDGTDLGVVRDACWLNHVIVRDYFNLQSSVSKIPANHVGCAMVRNIVVSAAVRAIENGAILIERSFSNSERQSIDSSAGITGAADAVQASGYYVDVAIAGKEVKYTLIYAKGDHIQKVSGVNTLV